MTSMTIRDLVDRYDRALRAFATTTNEYVFRSAAMEQLAYVGEMVRALDGADATSFTAHLTSAVDGLKHVQLPGSAGLAVHNAISALSTAALEQRLANRPAAW